MALFVANRATPLWPCVARCCGAFGFARPCTSRSRPPGDTPDTGGRVRSRRPYDPDPRLIGRRRGWEGVDEEGQTMSHRDAKHYMDVHHAKARNKIKDWTRSGKLERVEAFVQNMELNNYTPNTSTYNYILLAYGTRTEYVPRAFDLLRTKMFNSPGGKPNDVTFSVLFNMCAVHFPDHYSLALSLYRTLFRKRIQVSLLVANSAIKAFAKYGDSTTALKIFVDMSKKDVLVDKVATGGGNLRSGMVIKGDQAAQKKEDAELERHLDTVFTPFSTITPDVITYNSLMIAAGRDHRHRLFRPAAYLAAHLPALEATWTPDMRRRYSLDMADALFSNVEFYKQRPDEKLFTALLTAYRDAGRVDCIRLPGDFIEERRKHLYRLKGGLSKFDATRELNEMTGAANVAELEAERTVAVSDHYELKYNDDVDDAQAAYWTDDMDALKTPLTVAEKEALDKRQVPFGGIAEFLRVMATHQVAPTTTIFSLLWQCQVSAVVEGPMHSNIPKKKEVREQLSKVSPVGLMRVMRKYGCTPDNQFLYLLLKHQTMARNYEGALSIIRACKPYGVQLTINFYYELAFCCTTQVQASDLILDMREHGMLPDPRIYECLVSASLWARRPVWTLNTLKQAVDSGLIPTSNTMVLIDRFIRKKDYYSHLERDVRILHTYCADKLLPLLQPGPQRIVEPDEDARKFLGLDKPQDEEAEGEGAESEDGSAEEAVEE